MSKSSKKRKAPRKATPGYLENAGLYYLARFSSSCENFRRIMMRKVEKSARFHGTDMADGAAHVDALITRFVANGLLDDRAYAKSKTTGLHRRGYPERAIRSRLRGKGIADGIIDEALAELATEYENPQYTAAVRYAKRRRLGPFGPGNDRTGRRNKDMAAMARAGFGFYEARLVVEAKSPRELEDEIQTE